MVAAAAAAGAAASSAVGVGGGIAALGGGAETRLASWRTAVAGASQDRADRLAHDVRAALAADLDAPAALAAVDAWASEDAGDGSGADLVTTLLDARLGILL